MHPDQPSDPPTRLLSTPVGPLAVTDVGQGRPVVAIHGMPGTGRDFRWLGPVVEPHLRFIRLDLPGFGDSPPGAEVLPALLRNRRVPGAPLTRVSFANAVLAALDALELPRAVLLSHSFGGGIAVTVAAQAPERVAGLALLAPTGLRPNRGMRRFPAPPRVLAGVLATPGFGHLLRRRLEPGFRAMGFKCTEAEAHRSIIAVARWRFAETRRLAAQVRCPVLGAWTDDDHAVEPAIVHELLAHLPAGPRLGFATGGHNLQKSQATELGQALLDFVDALPGLVPPKT